MSDDIKRGATLSSCGLYRYELSRIWDDSRSPAVFIMLNPSTADAIKDDPTIRKCIGFARRFNAGGVIVGNLFAYRATKPADMMKAADPVGPKNQDYLERMCSDATRAGQGFIVCAWGNHGTHMDQDRTFMGWLDRLAITPRALRISKDGHPGHPLYIPYDAPLIEYAGRP